jgi:predicted transposase YdaD
MKDIIEPIDKFLKIYASEFPEHLFSMILGREIDKNEIKTEKTEIAVKTKRTDYVIKYKGIYYHLEFQLKYRKGYERKLFSYNAALTETLKSKVMTIVVYIEKHRKKPLNYYEVVDDFRFKNRFEFDSIELQDYKEYIEKDPYLAPFRIIIADKKTVDVLKKEKYIIDKEIENAEKKNNLYALLFIIGSRYFNYELLTKLLRREDMKTLKEFPLIKEWLIEERKEGKFEGLKEGIEKGMEKGMEKGIKEGKRLDILNLLELRFGQISKRLKMKLNKINDMKVLDNLFKKAVTAYSINEFDKTISEIRNSTKINNHNNRS